MKATLESLGAALAALVGAVILVASSVSGHSAVATPPADLSANDRGLDVWKTAALLVREETLAVADVRAPERFALGHLPGARSLPGASAAALADSAPAPLLLVADSDAEASRLAGELLALQPDRPVHFLIGGQQAWYLAFELPVPLFSEKAPPLGYELALGTVRAGLATPGSDRAAVLDALGRLGAMDYAPTLLGAKKPAAGGAKRKKIAGGCGG